MFGLLKHILSVMGNELIQPVC